MVKMPLSIEDKDKLEKIIKKRQKSWWVFLIISLVAAILYSWFSHWAVGLIIIAVAVPIFLIVKLMLVSGLKEDILDGSQYLDHVTFKERTSRFIGKSRMTCYSFIKPDNSTEDILMKWKDLRDMFKQAIDDQGVKSGDRLIFHRTKNGLILNIECPDTPKFIQ